MGWMIAPAAACLLMAAILGWFGLHVLQRGVIFVDLALAQVAALGATWAVYLGHHPDDPATYALSLVFTAAGAVAFSLVRRFSDRVPQEAIIGIAYAVSAAGAALLVELADDPHGAEKLRHLLVGNLVWVRWSEIALLAGVVAAVGALHWLVRRQMLLISHHPEQAIEAGMRIAWWDMLFYMSFGVVITALVPVAGVLLIFSFLVIPAVVARLFADGVRPRLAIAWALAFTIAVAGISVSYEHAAGPIVVVLLGLALLGALVWVGVRRSASPVRAALGVALAMAVLAAVLAAFRTGGHHHEVLAEEPAPAAASGPPADPVARGAWYHDHAADASALQEALGGETDPSLRLLAGAAMARAGDADGLRVLASLAAGSVPFLRMEADERLRQVAGDTAPDFDPLSGPDTSGAWAGWAEHPPEGWQEKARTIELP